MANDQKIFTFAGSAWSDNPLDVIQDCIEALAVLETLFGSLKKEPLSEETSEGVARIVHGVRVSLDSAAQNVSDRLHRPQLAERANDPAG